MLEDNDLLGKMWQSSADGLFLGQLWNMKTRRCQWSKVPKDRVSKVSALRIVIMVWGSYVIFGCLDTLDLAAGYLLPAEHVDMRIPKLRMPVAC